MIPVTADYVEKLIQEAEEANVPEERLKDLREHLAELRSGKLMDKAPAGKMCQEFKRADGTRIIRISDAPISFRDEDDLEKIEFKPVKRRPSPVTLPSLLSKLKKLAFR